MAAHLGIQNPDPEQRVSQLAASLGAPVVLTFHQRGWVLDTSPGKLVTGSNDRVMLAPFLAHEQFAVGRLAPDAGRSFCDAPRTGDVDLSTMVPGTARH